MDSISVIIANRVICQHQKDYGLGIIIFIAFGEEPVKGNTVAQRQEINNDDTHHRDPVLHYEVT
ncbi:MAG TPA: hypothetical protein VFC43_08430, partial [Methanoregula sp.]|nr:hypothetical protein [Methanoregula sp.]